MSADLSLPVNLDAERFILGSILLDDSLYPEASEALSGDDLSCDKHRRVYRRMGQIAARGERIDRVTVANELMKSGDLEAVGGLSYLVSLDEGLPQTPKIDSYIRIVREKSRLRQIIFAGHGLASEAARPNADPDALLKRVSERFLSLGEPQGGDDLQTPHEVLEAEMLRVGVDAFLSGSVRGIPTPLKRLNEIIVGLQKGDLILLGARPSVGKTALAMQTAHNAALAGVGCIFFSLEMSRLSLSSRIACSVANVDSQALRAGLLTVDEKRRYLAAVEGLRGLPLWIDKTSRTVQAMHAKIRRGRAKRDIGLVIVDYLQLMDSEERAESQNVKVSTISRGLKLAAEEFEVPVLALSQLSRPPKGQNPEPGLPDLRDSGSLEQDADVAIFLHSPDGRLGTGRRRVIVAKQRNGPVDSFDAAFVGQYQRFSEIAEEAA